MITPNWLLYIRMQKCRERQRQHEKDAADGKHTIPEDFSECISPPLEKNFNKVLTNWKTYFENFVSTQ